MDLNNHFLWFYLVIKSYSYARLPVGLEFFAYLALSTGSRSLSSQQVYIDNDNAIIIYTRIGYVGVSAKQQARAEAMKFKRN